MSIPRTRCRVLPGWNAGKDQRTSWKWFFRTVLSTIDSSIHVRPIVYMDAELPFVPEKDAPGVTAYREAVKTALKGHTITSMPHEKIIAKVDEMGKTFHIVVLKTTMTVGLRLSFCSSIASTGATMRKPRCVKR